MEWLRRSPARQRIRGRQQARCVESGLRFAFYGRTSTGRFQDPASSQEWQRETVIRVIAGRGRIVVDATSEVGLLALARVAGDQARVRSIVAVVDWAAGFGSTSAKAKPRLRSPENSPSR